MWVLPNDVSQDPQLDQATHHSHPPVPHQHLARGLILEEEVGEGAGDLALHRLSVSADPRRGEQGSLSSPHWHAAPRPSPPASLPHWWRKVRRLLS